MHVKALVFLMFVLACRSGADALGSTQTPGKADLAFEVRHSQAMDVFILMDSVSDWRPGWTQKEYQTFWIDRFGPLSAEDQRFIDAYAAFRRRSYHDSEDALNDTAGGPDGIFAKQSGLSATADPLAACFRSSTNAEAAISKLVAAFGQKDGDSLRGFYAHFQPKWQELLGSSQRLDRLAVGLQERLAAPAVAAYLDQAQRFYGTSVRGAYPVYVVWWPSPDFTAGKSRNGTLYLQINPLDLSEPAQLDSIILHEAAHFLSAHVAQSRKQELSRQFLHGCPIPENTNFLAYLEEPLAIAVGNAGYAALVLHEPLESSKDWYSDPRSDLLAKLIWPEVLARLERSEAMPLETVLHVAAFCSQIRAVGRSI